jgi:hypothetical protein
MPNTIAPKADKVKLLQTTPSNSKRHKNSLEEGHIKISLPDIGVEVRGVRYLIRPDRRVVIIFPSKAYPRVREKGKKPTKVSVPSVGFTNNDLWRSCVESLRKQVLEKYDQRQQRKGASK